MGHRGGRYPFSNKRDARAKRRPRRAAKTPTKSHENHAGMKAPRYLAIPTQMNAIPSDIRNAARIARAKAFSIPERLLPIHLPTAL